MGKRRRLEDLYVTGKELVFDDGATEEQEDPETGEKITVPLGPVTVWLQKLNPVDTSTALARAQAARSRTRTAAKRPETTDYQAAWLEVLDIGEKEELASYLLADARGGKQMVVESRLAAEKEWSEDDYLDGLQEAWSDGLEEAWLKDKEEPEAKRVHDELERFADQTKAEVDAELEAMRRDYAEMPLEELQQKVLKTVLDYRSNTVWLDEYHRCELWLGVRDPENHKERYFERREEIDGLPAEVMKRLYQEYQELAVDVMEGKESGLSPSSSPSSEAPDEEETDASSGLVAVSP